jgi:diguanylate cyclase
LTLSLLLAILAFGTAWRIGRLTSSLQASERQNRHLALHDTLSGLANRLQFNRVLKTATRDLPASPFALIHCDLDKFKFVNDTHGHAAGDTVIRAVAQRLTDIIGNGGLVARLGGDEFVILYRSFTDHGRLTLLSGQLIGAVETPIPLENGQTAEVSLSIGIVTAPECGSTPEGLMAAADNALYYSKENGRGQAAFANDIKHLFAMSVSGTEDDPTSDAA